MNCPWWLSRQLPMSSSVLLMASTVAMAYVPSCERTSRGWGSLSLMQPMALVPWKSSMSRSKRVRNGAFSMEWIWRWKPRSWSSTTMPARRVPDASDSQRQRTRPAPRLGGMPRQRIRPRAFLSNSCPTALFASPGWPRRSPRGLAQGPGTLMCKPLTYSLCAVYDHSCASHCLLAAMWSKTCMKSTRKSARKLSEARRSPERACQVAFPAPRRRCRRARFCVRLRVPISGG